MTVRARRLFLATGALVVVCCMFPREAPASVEEQRARLPPPAECTDELEGEWLALTYSPVFSDWYQVRLTVRRTAPGASTIVGDMYVRFWNGGDKDQNPPSCADLRAFERVVVQPSQGMYVQGEVQFHAQSWRWAPESCHKGGRYNLDNYSGKIDHKLHEFQSVNNDGGRAVNEPAVFRRVKCLGAPDAPQVTERHLDVQPPSFTPRRRWGCGK